VKTCDNWEVFPNPNQGILYIDFKDIESIESCKLILNDLRGREVGFWDINSPEMKLNLNMQKPGFYFLRISNCSESQCAQKIYIR